MASPCGFNFTSLITRGMEHRLMFCVSISISPWVNVPVHIHTSPPLPSVSHSSFILFFFSFFQIVEVALYLFCKQIFCCLCGDKTRSLQIWLNSSNSRGSPSLDSAVPLLLPQFALVSVSLLSLVIAFLRI